MLEQEAVDAALFGPAASNLEVAAVVRERAEAELASLQAELVALRRHTAMMAEQRAAAEQRAREQALQSQAQAEAAAREARPLPRSFARTKKKRRSVRCRSAAPMFSLPLCFQVAATAKRKAELELARRRSELEAVRPRLLGCPRL